MNIQSLNGQWRAQCENKKIEIPADVPGDIYSDLLAAKMIPDPFCRDNELALQWIGESDWCFERHFNITQDLLDCKKIFLRCQGLDTLAKITINGHKVAETDNMFRAWEFDVKKLLKSGKNKISILFSSAKKYIDAKGREFEIDGAVKNIGYIRKEHCNFGWDWGIKATTCGIWRGIEIIAFNEARIADFAIKQDHHIKGKVKLGINISLDRNSRAKLKAKVSLKLRDKQVFTEQVGITGRKTELNITVKDPELWWPNNMGNQALYDISIEIYDRQGVLIDSLSKRIGLRTLVLDRHKDKWGESFQFVINGKPFFVKGANWIPVDAILARRSPEIYQRLIGAAADCNMNMLRVWGGGIYEDDCFYEICDELGICVWQDFMFACASYPIFDKKFIANVIEEVRDNIKRLRHHSCLALWCGNNELEMMNVGSENWENGTMPWKEYKKLFDKIIPEQVKALSPEIPYWPSSPHSPKGDRRKHRNHLYGDAHLWIMSGRYPFDCAKGMEHRFASEFGFQSFPEPKTVKGFSIPEDHNISSRIMEHHQRAPGGNITLMQQILKCFKMPDGFENTLWVSQIMQGAGVKSVCEHFRREMPRCMGTLYWQLNDCWPVASWASIDFKGQWKAMHYMAKKFFSPALISGVVNTENKTVEISLTSDLLNSLKATVVWTITDVQGNVLGKGRKQTKTPINGSRIVKTLTMEKLLTAYEPYNLLVWLDLEIKDEPSPQNIIFFTPPKHMELDSDPGICHKVSKNKDGSFYVELKSHKVALWVWLELKDMNAVFSDNFFHLRPGINEKVCINPERKINLQQLKRSLIVRSLVDTY